MKAIIQLQELYFIFFFYYFVKPYSCEVGYERFLGPEMFFHPEFFDSKWKTPIDEAIDKAIQGSPIDYRRKLYSVEFTYKKVYRILFYQEVLLYLMDLLQDYKK